MSTEGYLTAKQAAEYLATPYRTFDKLVRREGIPCEWIGRQRRFKRSVLDRAVRAMTLRRQQTGPALRRVG